MLYYTAFYCIRLENLDVQCTSLLFYTLLSTIIFFRIHSARSWHQPHQWEQPLPWLCCWWVISQGWSAPISHCFHRLRCSYHLFGRSHLLCSKILADRSDLSEIVWKHWLCHWILVYLDYKKQPNEYGRRSSVSFGYFPEWQAYSKLLVLSYLCGVFLFAKVLMVSSSTLLFLGGESCGLKRNCEIGIDEVIGAGEET